MDPPSFTKAGGGSGRGGDPGRSPAERLASLDELRRTGAVTEEEYARARQRIVDDLGARIRLVRRRYSSYTPDPATGGRTGLLVGPESTFGAVGAAADEAPATEGEQV